MTLELEVVLRCSEAALALVLLQQCAEHLLPGAGARTSRLGSPSAALLAALRVPLALLLLSGLQPLPALVGLAVLALASLLRFDGPYNGGSDRLGMLMLACLLAARLFPEAGPADGRLPEAMVPRMALGYLALQLVASYFFAGWVKLVNPAWRSGEALREVFAFSAYPVSESLRGWARWPRLLRAMAWGVILLELAFPLALLDARLLWAALSLAALFHLANALLFGLNRFLWTWLAAYPALLWFQQQLPVS
jgi:hypothetical protein